MNIINIEFPPDSVWMLGSLPHYMQVSVCILNISI